MTDSRPAVYGVHPNGVWYMLSKSAFGRIRLGSLEGTGRSGAKEIRE